MKLSEQIKAIVDTWEGFDRNDVGGVINLRRDLSVYYYNLSEYKSQQESKYLVAEYYRKDYFNARKVYYIGLGETATLSASKAELDCAEKRKIEIEHESNYKSAKDMLSSLDHVLNAMSSAIKVAENEQRQSNYHT